MLAGPRPSVAGGRAEHESERRPWGRGPRCVANQTWVATCGRALPAGEGHPAFTRTERLGASPHSRRRGPPVGSSAGEFLSGGKGDLTFPQVEGLDAWGIALASPTPAARLRDNPARALREARGAPICPHGLKRSEWPSLFCILIRIIMHIYVCYNETHTSRKGCGGQHGITCAAPAAKSHAISLLGRRRRWIARPSVHLIFYELNANDSHPASTN